MDIFVHIFANNCLYICLISLDEDHTLGLFGCIMTNIATTYYPSKSVHFSVIKLLLLRLIPYKDYFLSVPRLVSIAELHCANKHVVNKSIININQQKR